MASNGSLIKVECGNVLDYQCDVLVLKYAQEWHGADLEAAKRLKLHRKSWHGPLPGNFKDVRPQPSSDIKADTVLFAGMPSLNYITYSTIRDFGNSSLVRINELNSDTRHIVMTMHGANFGMDEKESFLSQIAGISEALGDRDVLPALERISIVELGQSRADRLERLLISSRLDTKPVSGSTKRTRGSQFPGKRRAAVSDQVARAGLNTEKKSHVFVAMPFTSEMEDVFVFGIQGPVQDAGMLCERVDMATFTGDILERIKTRIETAALVIADLTGANANVYLEVGFAWGKGTNTILLCRDIEELKFDVRGQRCLTYSSIRDLKEKLSEELKVLT